jgi:hypothetical protein
MMEENTRIFHINHIFTIPFQPSMHRTYRVSKGLTERSHIIYNYIKQISFTMATNVCSLA